MKHGWRGRQLFRAAAPRQAPGALERAAGFVRGSVRHRKQLTMQGVRQNACASLSNTPKARRPSHEKEQEKGERRARAGAALAACCRPFPISSRLPPSLQVVQDAFGHVYVELFLPSNLYIHLACCQAPQTFERARRQQRAGGFGILARL